MNCRICLESIPFHEAVGNMCGCKEVYFHETCAIKWFAPRVQGICRGRAIDTEWKTAWYASCEVCNHNIEDAFVQKCVLYLKKESFQRLKKSNNPIILPNVPEIVVQNEVVSRSRPITNAVRTHTVPVQSPRPATRNSNRSIFACFSRPNSHEEPVSN